MDSAPADSLAVAGVVLESGPCRVNVARMRCAITRTKPALQLAQPQRLSGCGPGARRLHCRRPVWRM